jgi:hypothetical protein
MRLRSCLYGVSDVEKGGSGWDKMWLVLYSEMEQEWLEGLGLYINRLRDLDIWEYGWGIMIEGFWTLYEVFWLSKDVVGAAWTIFAVWGYHFTLGYLKDILETLLIVSWWWMKKGVNSGGSKIESLLEGPQSEQVVCCWVVCCWVVCCVIGSGCENFHPLSEPQVSKWICKMNIHRENK